MQNLLMKIHVFTSVIMYFVQFQGDQCKIIKVIPVGSIQASQEVSFILKEIAEDENLRTCEVKYFLSVAYVILFNFL